jgi:hypothetical protein
MLRRKTKGAIFRLERRTMEHNSIGMTIRISRESFRASRTHAGY